jgi:hypothetical protein
MITLKIRMVHNLDPKARSPKECEASFPEPREHARKTVDVYFGTTPCRLKLSTGTFIGKEKAAWTCLPSDLDVLRAAAQPIKRVSVETDPMIG